MTNTVTIHQFPPCPSQSSFRQHYSSCNFSHLPLILEHESLCLPHPPPPLLSLLTYFAGQKYNHNKHYVHDTVDPFPCLIGNVES